MRKLLVRYYMNMFALEPEKEAPIYTFIERCCLNHINNHHIVIRNLQL